MLCAGWWKPLTATDHINQQRILQLKINIIHKCLLIMSYGGWWAFTENFLIWKLCMSIIMIQLPTWTLVLKFYVASKFLSFLCSIKSHFSPNNCSLSVKFKILIWKYDGVCMYCGLSSCVLARPWLSTVVICWVSWVLYTVYRCTPHCTPVHSWHGLGPGEEDRRRPGSQSCCSLLSGDAGAWCSGPLPGRVPHYSPADPWSRVICTGRRYFSETNKIRFPRKRGLKFHIFQCSYRCMISFNNQLIKCLSKLKGGFKNLNRRKSAKYWAPPPIFTHNLFYQNDSDSVDQHLEVDSSFRHSC